jgi:excisionase family DNA binding protein
MDVPMSGLVTRGEAARRLGVSAPTLRRMIALGQVPTVAVGDRSYVHADDIERLKLERAVFVGILNDLMQPAVFVALPAHVRRAVRKAVRKGHQ